MVPDVSGIDKIFDYIVPKSLVGRIHVGARVRVNLNGRRVPGWIVALADEADAHLTVPLERLAPIVSVSGHGVEPEIVPLTQWLASEFLGTWRAALSRASAPTVRSGNIHPRHGTASPVVEDSVIAASRRLVTAGGGLLVAPPSASVLNVVADLAQHGAVLVVCPTQNMASLGAASLRRRGLTTAVVPDDWHIARVGVDVVLGARSAALAPCARLSAIVVIDEHDELHHDERAPTWNAVSVAQERSRRAGVPLVLTSALPSAESAVAHRESTEVINEQPLWPRFIIENLDDVPVAGSLLSSALLSSVTQINETTVCVLNTKGKARLLVCKSCRTVQACTTCSSLLSQNDDGQLSCLRCQTDQGSVCLSCGRTAFSVPRGGVAQLISQLEKSTRKSIVEVTAESDNSWTQGSVFVGTEAALFRVPHADTVVFADIDRDLSAPRVTAPREVAALLIRAARLVGSRGTVVVQTRTPNHPLLMAFGDSNVTEGLMEWNLKDIEQRRVFSLPPFAELVSVSLADDESFVGMPTLDGVDTALMSGQLILKSISRDSLREAIDVLRGHYGARLRVHADPTRY